ncbi:MAG: hypothetical protein US55_C0062G0009 [Candidatus Levybacteria bacterium GW2011_GWC2_37_7]|nr:MAG: hypothetical protein US55_C0062G0009 [Candidatus Levybacteria bacterium GW2011_GWC2_37_7]
MPKIETKDRSIRSRREVPVKNLPIWDSGWVLARRPVGKDAFIALIANDMGTRIIAAVKDGPEDLKPIEKKIEEATSYAPDWIVLNGNHIIGKQENRKVAVYGDSVPMNLTAVKLLSLKDDQEVTDINEGLKGLVEKAVNFVKVVQSIAK